MGIDPFSFVLGFGTASGLSYAVYRNRERLSRVSENSAAARPFGAIQNLREILQQSSGSRYASELAEYLKRQHLGGDLVSITDILIEPHLFPLPKEKLEFDDPNAAPSFDSYEYIVPHIHEFPQLISSYYMNSLPLSDVVAGDPHVMILGKSGMGKSTALVTLALMALGEVTYETLQSLTEQALEEAYADLPEAEREQRLKELNEIQKKLVEKLQQTQKNVTDEIALEPPPPLTSFFPIYVNMGSIDLDLNHYGMRVDPAEPLIQAYQQYSSVVAAQISPPMMYDRLTRGDCLVLLDGFEDIPESDQKRLYGWLQSFLEYYGHNRIVMTGPVNHYDVLETLGFTPVFIKPWSPEEAHLAAEKWLHAWETLANDSSKRSSEVYTIPDANLQNQMYADLHHRSPFEITLRTLAHLRGTVENNNLHGWVNAYIEPFLPDSEHSHPILREVTTLMLERDLFFLKDQIMEIVTNHLVPDEEAPPLANVDQFNQKLFKGGLLVGRAGNKYDFRHVLLRAFFGAEAMIHDMTPQRLAELGDQPNWHFAFRYAAGQTELGGAVGKKLSSETDIVLSNLFTIVDWIHDAPPDSSWRSEILKRITALMLAPTQYMPLRERALAALIASRDENLSSIFRQAVRNGNPAIRKLGCLGIGAIRAEDAIEDLRPMLVDDDYEVQIAAALSLGAISSERSLEILVQGLLQGGEILRQVVAQTLAMNLEEGHQILRDAAEHDDMSVRRASVFGLARIHANWSLIALYNLMIHDEQWYVRSSAEDQFFIARNPEREGIKKPTPAAELPWLQAWASNVGVQEFPVGEEALDLLVQTLRDKRQQVRLMGVRALGSLGGIKGIMPLYAMLMDADAKIRTEAYAALGILQSRMTILLPSIL